MIYLNGISLEMTLIKQIKCSILKFLVMRSIYITLLSIFITVSLIGQVSFDTTYTKEWDSNLEQWNYFDRMITEFNDQTMSSQLIQVNENDTWVNYSLVSFYYNNGNLIQEIEKTWDGREEEWINSYRKLYSYDQGHLASILHQYIFNGVSVNSQREIMQYDEHGNLQEKVVQKYEEAWTNFLKYKYFYNASDLILDENLTYWDDNDWGNEGFSVSYSYDDNQQIVKKVKTRQHGNKTKNMVCEEYSYTEDGRLDNHLLSVWNSAKNKWVNKNRAVYVNNMNGYIVSMLNQSRSKKEWINYLYTDFTGDNDPITGMDIADGMTFSIYPINFGKEAKVEFDNPFNETYFVKVVDQQGRMIGSATTSKNEVSIDARNMGRGLYFIELQGRNFYSGNFSIE